MLYRDEYYNTESSDNGVMEVIVSKNRNGTTSICNIKYSKKNTYVLPPKSPKSGGLK